MPVAARRWLRRMRGGAQAQLIEAADGHCYVVKARNNPQHRRVLVNEWVAGTILRYLQIAGPEPAIVVLEPAFLDQFPDCAFQLGKSRTPVDPGWHFGSRMPGHPDKLAVYDFLPSVLLEQVANLRDFVGVLLFDKWVCNADARQSIFFRAQFRQGDRERPGFITWMIDHGFAFNGPHWEYPDAAGHGLYCRREVYAAVRNWADLEPWLTRIEHFPESVLDEAIRQIPLEWLAEGEDSQLEALLEKLLTRRKRMRALVEDLLLAGPKPPLFTNWR